jgi:hypothetical protein
LENKVNQSLFDSSVYDTNNKQNKLEESRVVPLTPSRGYADVNFKDMMAIKTEQSIVCQSPLPQLRPS